MSNHDSKPISYPEEYRQFGEAFSNFAETHPAEVVQLLIRLRELVETVEEDLSE